MNGLHLLAIGGQLAGIGLFVDALRHTRRVRASQSWAITEGRVVAVTPISIPGTRGGGAADAGITYAYRVNGVEYRSSRLRFTGVAPGDEQDVAARYQVHATLPVRYDPEDPGEAVLELDSTRSYVVQAVVGVVLALAGAAAIAVLPN